MIDALTSFISSAGWLAPFWYVASFVISALLPFIPTPLIGALGGTAFGFLPAVIYGLFGLGLGALTALTLSRHLGRRIIDLLVPRTLWSEWEKLLGIESVSMWGVIFFVLNLDIAVVAAGLSTFPIRQLWVAAMIARIPWLVASAWFGDAVLVSDAVLILVMILMIPALWGLRQLRPRIRRWLIRVGGKAE
jgi:uncharacterized membrane protein YdjX (TVP38/TMEM64 family)